MAITSAEQERFERALSGVAFEGASSIGTQSEKPVHRALKCFLASSDECHEVRVGKFIADVMTPDGHIYEIQTRDFGRLRDKLNAFLPEHKVTVVYPVFGIKYLSWIDAETGEIEGHRKSPRRGRASDILGEIYRLQGLETHPNLDYLVVVLEAEEYRLKDGWSADQKHGSHRYVCVPLSLLDMVPLQNAADFNALFTEEALPSEFVAKEAAKPLGVKGLKLSAALQALCRVNAVEKTDKHRGRAVIYQRKA